MQKDSVLEIMKDLRNSLMLQKEVLTMEEATSFTGFEKSYMYKLCSHRKIPHYKTPGGKSTFFDRKELCGWLKTNRIKPHYEIDAEVETHLNSFKSK